jgi:hypothetical protein
MEPWNSLIQNTLHVLIVCGGAAYLTISHIVLLYAIYVIARYLLEFDPSQHDCLISEYAMRLPGKGQL